MKGTSLQASPAVLMTVLACLLAVGVSLTSWFVSGPVVLTFSLSAGFAAVALGGVFLLSESTSRSIAVALGLVGQAIALTAAFEGHEWQTHSHMMYFALLAIVVGLGSVRAILAGVGLIAAHHVSFVFVAPALLFPSADLFGALALTAFHASVVVLEASALIVAVLARQRLDAKTAQDAQDLAASAHEASVSRDKALAAQQQAENASEQARAEAQRAEEALAQGKRDQEAREKAQAETRARAEKAHAEEIARGAATTQVVEAMRDALARLSDGDLTARIDTPFDTEFEDLRASFNRSVESLEAVIADVSEEIRNFEAQASEIKAAANDLAVRTEQQAATLQDTAESLNQLTKNVAEARVSVDNATGETGSARELASNSREVAERANASMTNIEKGSEEIGAIVSVIDDIAFQTNLLALNAGVEAARAGEAGRGFAVVASEVRELARRSSESAGSIRELIAASGRQVADGADRMRETATALDKVGGNVTKIAGQMEEIAGSARSQEREISTINESVSRLDQVTQANAAMFEETSAASTRLSSSAAQLHKTISIFRTSASADKIKRAA